MYAIFAVAASWGAMAAGSGARDCLGWPVEFEQTANQFAAGSCALPTRSGWREEMTTIQNLRGHCPTEDLDFQYLHKGVQVFNAVRQSSGAELLEARRGAPRRGGCFLRIRANLAPDICTCTFNGVAHARHTSFRREVTDRVFHSIVRNFRC